MPLLGNPRLGTSVGRLVRLLGSTEGALLGNRVGAMDGLLFGCLLLGLGVGLALLGHVEKDAVGTTTTNPRGGK